MKKIFSCLFYALFCLFTVFFMFFSCFCFAQKIKSDEDFIKKLTLYKEYLYQDWEIVQHKEIENILDEFEKEMHISNIKEKIKNIELSA